MIKHGLPGNLMPVSSRREFLGLAALMLLPPTVLQAGTRASAPLLVSAASDANDKHWVVGLGLNDKTANVLYQQALPARGHYVAVSQRHGIYVALARRPGTWLVVGNLHSGEIHAQIQVPAERHLYGHGIFSADENRFYTTESNFPDMNGDSGLLVEWEVTEQNGKAILARQREFKTRGVGPHELLLMPDGQTLVIANGGLRTHPDSEREVLNADTMLPSLVYMDCRSGQVVEQVFLPEKFHQASIRHMDVNAAGQIAIGLQFQGEPYLSVPLIATHNRSEELRLLMATPEVQTRMKQYVGSVRYSSDGNYFAASCPRGNLLTFWDSASGELLHTIRSRDGCGVCATAENGFVFSSGTGKVSSINLVTTEICDFSLPEQWLVFWDNHLSTAAGAA